MLQPYHERAPSYRAQQYRPGIPLDPALRCDLCDGMPVVRGRIAQPGEWLVLDSEGCVTVWSDHDARARFAIPEERPEPRHVGFIAGIGVSVSAPPEPLTANLPGLNVRQVEEVVSLIREQMRIRDAAWEEP